MGDIDVEAGRQRAVDDAVVGGQRQGRVRRGTNCLPSHTGFITDLLTPRMATSGRIDDGREVGAADAAEAGDGEAGAGHVGRPSLPSRAFLASSPDSAAISKTLFLSAFLTTGTTRPFGVSAAKPMLKYFFQTRLSPSSAAVELGELLQRAHRGLDDEGEHGELLPDFSFSLFIWTRKASRSVMSASS